MKKITLILMILMVLINVAFSQIDLENGLIAHFPFNENTYDVSGNGNDGQVNGPKLTTDRFNTPNSAYLFDGVDDIIDIPNYMSMSPTDAVTIAAWINTNSSIGAPIIYDRLETNDGFGLRITSNGNLRLTINGGIQDAISSKIISDGQWHHVVGTYDKNMGELKVYVDGIEDGSSTYFSTITYTPEPRNSIGGPGGVNPIFYDGKIDGLRVYDRALSICEIQTLAEIEIDLQNGLIAHFPFNENTYDVSGNGNDGQVNDPVLTTDRFDTPNSAYLFDGVDDIIDIPNYMSMSPTDAVTIAAWINTNSSIGAPIIYDRLETNDGFGLRITSNGNLRLTINGGIQDAISSKIISDGQWHHVVGTYDKNMGELKVYVDGIEDGSSTYFSTITYTPEPRNSIGGPGGVNPIFYDGKIDGLRVYDRALSICEIQNLCALDSDTQVTSVAKITENNTNLILFPNPVNDLLNIRNFDLLNSEGVFTIFDMLGNVVFQKSIKDQNTLKVDVNNLRDGTYLLHISSKGNIDSQLFLKMDN